MRDILKSERKQVILDTIKAQKFIRLEDLVDLLHSSESTVRRDLDELELAGKLRRVHGGAESLPHLQEEESIAQKSIKNIQEKQKIAQKAASFIEEGDVVFLDAGTTTELMIDYVSAEDLTVVTNSVHHAVKLVEKGFYTIIIGGKVKSATDASIGAVALEQIRQLHFTKAFLGMNGVDSNDYTTPDVEEAAIKRMVLQNANQTYILTDLSKLGHISFAKVAEVGQADLICPRTDSNLMATIKKKTRVIEV
ncbi:DeoR/GlpR transcriptional regulator [Streptococcus acidominimus]|uniref:DeoR/GlpR transcriptional regulator n=1 Tax=Streptococcus acidominimus TaxID=1326 RepID=A0A4Y9FKF2_STRAI|nr:DeoR/GlpR transcriptional regulator [Streptococcus acidominimus]